MSERTRIEAKTTEVKKGNSVYQQQNTELFQPMRSPADQILFLQRTAGNQAVQRLLRQGALQAKLRIASPGDIYEQEADRMANHVMRMPAAAVQLKHDCPFAKDSSCKEKEKIIQTKKVNGETTQFSQALESPINSLMDAGQPLPESVSTFFEPRFGHDFSRVRVHSDAEAARSARELNAHAYTIGQDIVFGANRFAPHTHDGQHLIAHELTHVVQQSGTDGTRSGQRNEIGGLYTNTIQRVPVNNEKLSENRHGSTLPYREAKNLTDCLRIMGPDSTQYCRREVLGEDIPDASLQMQPDRIALDLESLIAGAVWKEIRKRVYPKESAAGIQRAKDRKAGKLSDLSGLGKIKTLEHFAGALRTIQGNWTSLSTADNRVKELGKAANVELTGAEVPGFLAVGKKKMEFKGSFRPSQWSFTISEELVSAPSLNNDDAAQVANTTLHESRHAEQQFLAARFSAGVKNKNATGIVAEQGIPKVIADEAVAKKFDNKTDPTAKALGMQMYQATVTESAKNQAISDDDGLADLAVKRADAEKALKSLKANATKQTIADAIARRNALRAQIIVVEQKYTLYRNIPYEADAHEVGDAVEQAFKGWP